MEGILHERKELLARLVFTEREDCIIANEKMPRGYEMDIFTLMILQDMEKRTVLLETQADKTRISCERLDAELLELGSRIAEMERIAVPSRGLADDEPNYQDYVDSSEMRMQVLDGYATTVGTKNMKTDCTDCKESKFKMFRSRKREEKKKQQEERKALKNKISYEVQKNDDLLICKVKSINPHTGEEVAQTDRDLRDELQKQIKNNSGQVAVQLWV